MCQICGIAAREKWTPGALDELTVNMIPMQFEDEENVGGPYSKLDEKPPEAPLDDPEARAKKEEADRAALRKRIDEVMGWKE